MSHEVTIDLPRRILDKTDVHFRVKRNGTSLGKLEVSRGALVWYPRNRTVGHKISWSNFDAMMKEYPRRERRKRM